MLVEGNDKLEIIQGDSFSLNITLENVPVGMIDSVFFSSNALNITKKLTNQTSTNTFSLDLTSNETKTFSNGYFDYDLTIRFVDNSIKTIVYRSSIVVLSKINEVSGL